MGSFSEEGTIFTPSNPFLECELYTLYRAVVGNTEQCLQKIVPYKRMDNSGRDSFVGLSLRFW